MWSGSAWTLVIPRHYFYDEMLVIQERNGPEEGTPLVSYTRGWI
jgi:hypothetical protein